MTKRLAPALLAAGFIVAISGSPAHADLKVTWHMTMDSPMMRNMPAQTRSMIDSYMNPMTFYMSTRYTRTDTPMIGVIIDRTGKTMTMVNQMMKTYSVSPFDPSKPGQMPGMGPMGAAQPSDINVTDTGKTKTILSHKCHELIVTGKIQQQQQQGTNMSFKDDMWVAADLSPVGSAAQSIPFAGLGAGSSKIDGFPLEMTVTMTGGPADGTTVDIETTDLSTDTLPASTFQVPDGFTKSDGPMFGPGMGGPRPGMGGGMPPTQ